MRGHVPATWSCQAGRQAKGGVQAAFVGTGATSISRGERAGEQHIAYTLPGGLRGAAETAKRRSASPLCGVCIVCIVSRRRDAGRGSRLSSASAQATCDLCTHAEATTVKSAEWLNAGTRTLTLALRQPQHTANTARGAVPAVGTHGCVRWRPASSRAQHRPIGWALGLLDSRVAACVQGSAGLMHGPRAPAPPWPAPGCAPASVRARRAVWQRVRGC